MNHQHDQLALRPLDAEISRKPMVEGASLDRHQRRTVASNNLRGPVIRLRVDNDNLKRKRDALFRYRVEQGRQRRGAVQRRHHDRHERTGHDGARERWETSAEYVSVHSRASAAIVFTAHPVRTFCDSRTTSPGCSTRFCRTRDSAAGDVAS